MLIRSLKLLTIWLLSQILPHIALSDTPKILADGSRVFYRWTKKRRAREMITSGKCLETVSALIQNSSSDNTHGSALYFSANPYNSSGHGSALVEIHISPDAPTPTSYTKPGNDNIIWYVTRDKEGVSFHKFSGSELSNEELADWLFRLSGRLNSPHALQRDIDSILWQRFDQQKKKDLLSKDHPILFINGYQNSQYIYSSIKGSLLVKNLRPDKRVRIIYSSDGFKSSHSADLHFSDTIEQNREIWSFELSQISSPKNLEFYFIYEDPSRGEVYYESNLGNNFRISDLIQP